MKRSILFAACLLALSTSHATHCQNGLPDSYYPACIPPTTSQPSTLTQQQQQAAIAGAAAGAVSGSTSGATATGLGGAGGSANASGAGANAGAGAGAAAGQYAGQGAGAGAGSNTGNGNGATVVLQGDAAGSGDSYRALALPPVVPPTPPTAIAGATVVTTTGACGPLQRVVRTAVTGTFMGVFSNNDVPQGYTDELAPYMDEYGREVPYREISGRLFGHQITQYSAVIGVGGARNVAIGGGGSSGSWGQGGGGASGGAQQLVIAIQLRLCQIEMPAVQPTQIIFQPPAPAVVPAPRVGRAKAPVRRPVAAVPAKQVVAEEACVADAKASCQVRRPAQINLTRQ